MASFGFEIEFVNIHVKSSDENFRFKKDDNIAKVVNAGRDLFYLRADGDLESQIQRAVLEIVSFPYDTTLNSRELFNQAVTGLNYLRSKFSELLRYINENNYTTIRLGAHGLPLEGNYSLVLCTDTYTPAFLGIFPTAEFDDQAIKIAPQFTYGMEMPFLSAFYNHFSPERYDLMWHAQKDVIEDARCPQLFRDNRLPYAEGTRAALQTAINNQFEENNFINHNNQNAFVNLYNLVEFFKYYLGSACIKQLIEIHFIGPTEVTQLKYEGYKYLFGLMSRTSFKLIFQNTINPLAQFFGDTVKTKQIRAKIIDGITQYLINCFKEEAIEGTPVFRVVYGTEVPIEIFNDVSRLQIGPPNHRYIQPENVNLKDSLRNTVGIFNNMISSSLCPQFNLSNAITCNSTGGIPLVVNINEHAQCSSSVNNNVASTNIQYINLPQFYRDLLHQFRESINASNTHNTNWNGMGNIGQQEINMLKNIGWYDWFSPVPTMPAYYPMGRYSRPRSPNDIVATLPIIEVRFLAQVYMNAHEDEAPCFNDTFFAFMREYHGFAMNNFA